jgi:hypothetical protein
MAYTVKNYLLFVYQRVLFNADPRDIAASWKRTYSQVMISVLLKGHNYALVDSSSGQWWKIRKKHVKNSIIVPHSYSSLWAPRQWIHILLWKKFLCISLVQEKASLTFYVWDFVCINKLRKANTCSNGIAFQN